MRAIMILAAAATGGLLSPRLRLQKLTLSAIPSPTSMCRAPNREAPGPSTGSPSTTWGRSPEAILTAPETSTVANTSPPTRPAP